MAGAFLLNELRGAAVRLGQAIPRRVGIQASPQFAGQQIQERCASDNDAFTRENLSLP